jgi:hypothetical protein
MYWLPCVTLITYISYIVLNHFLCIVNTKLKLLNCGKMFATILVQFIVFVDYTTYKSFMNYINYLVLVVYIYIIFFKINI